MANKQLLAEHGVALCVLGLGLSSASAPLASIAVVGVALHSIWRNCRFAKRATARDAGMARLAALGITERQAEVALHYLKDYEIRFEVDPDLLKDAQARGSFPQTLYDTLFDPKTIPPDDRIPEALFAIVEGAWDVLRQEEHVHKLFTQESLAHLERLIGMRLQSLEELVASEFAQLKEMVTKLQQELSNQGPRLSATAQTLLDNESFIVALAFNYAEGSPKDFETALRGLERALEVAAEERERGKLPANTDDAVNAVIARVDDLNAAGQLDEAAAVLEEEEARAQAGLIRLYDKGISQAILTRDVEAAVAYELKKQPWAAPEEQEAYTYLRGVFVEWYDRGDQKGLNFDLEVAIAMMRHIASRFESNRDQKGACLNNLGNTLAILGERESGMERLEHAVAAYGAALEEMTRDRVPLDWARTQMNLGSALLTLGARESGTERLEQAVIAYRAALEELTRDRVPLDWAMTQNNLGISLRNLGERESGTEKLEQAVAAFRAALKEQTRDRAPLDWAGTQMNLGNALLTLGERESGTELLEQAVIAYRATLEGWTRDRVPLDWAMTQMNLGTALAALGRRETGTGRLEEAIVAYREALEERTRNRVPLEWANTIGNEAVALITLAERTEDAALAARARDQLIEAEQVLREGGHAAWAKNKAEQIPEAEALVARLSDKGDRS